jgi:hypothetical protein
MAADFIQSALLFGKGRKEWVRTNVELMRAKGATWFRLSHEPDKEDLLFLEGWITRPDDQGPEPWRKT